MARFRKPKSGPRKLYDLITEETQEGAEVLALVQEVKNRWKKDLNPARIGAAWMIGKRADRDGRVMLGRLKKCSELEKQMNKLDAIVLLNQDRFRLLSKEQRLALVHHEMCHLAESLDNNLNAAYDGHGERKWRLVKHDLEEFREVVRTHGAYKSDIAAFVEDLVKKDPNLSLFDKSRNANAEKPIGQDVMSVTLGDGKRSVTLTAVPPIDDAPNRKLITNRGKKAAANAEAS